MTARERSTLYVKDMLKYARYAERFVASTTKEEFEQNEEKQLAVVRALEVVGEAAKSVPEEVRTLEPEIPWPRISGMRDKLIHHYFGVRLDAVWAVPQKDVKSLIPQLQPLIDTLETSADSNGPKADA